MKPILFNTEMVRAILDGRKTVTRRVAFKESDLRPFPRKNDPDGWWFRGRAYRNWDDAMESPQAVMRLCRYRPGNILYVRETWARVSDWTTVDPSAGMPDGYIYRADWPDGEHPRWHPSIHMPKEAARQFLRVTDVRVERLQEITEEQARAEGVPKAFEYNTPEGPVITLDEDGHFYCGFKTVWNSTIKPADRNRYGWAANPWVWVIEFERISKEEAEHGTTDL